MNKMFLASSFKDVAKQGVDKIDIKISAIEIVFFI